MGFFYRGENYKSLETKILLKTPSLEFFRRGFAEVSRPLRGGFAEKTGENRVKRFFLKKNKFVTNLVPSARVASFLIRALF